MDDTDQPNRVSRRELAIVAALTAVVIVLLSANLTRLGEQIAAWINPVRYSGTAALADFICPAAIAEGGLRTGCSHAALASNPNISGFVDSAATTPAGLRITGWAADRGSNSEVALIAVTVNGVLRGAGPANNPRPDVAAALGLHDHLKTGFDLTVPIDGPIQPADLNVRVFGIAADGRFWELSSTAPFFKRG